ncbi:thioredoxin-like protein [Lipomyces japonicus]|uniref:thioredoxin-like protein n=1 Tax=Lipomyces japonicus TaxID=56871 RepID=UPI0034D01966
MSSASKLVPLKPIKLYASRTCPWAARTWIILTQLNVEFEYIEIDLRNKPEWFLRDVNPGGKVPTLKYGDDYLIESAITTEFVANLFPETNLIPKDPFVSAEARLLTDRFQEFVSPVYREVVFQAKTEAADKLFDAIDKFLPYLKNAAPFFNGSDHPLLAEILIAPFVSRLYLLLESKFVANETFTKLSTDPKYKYFHEWAVALINSPGVTGTFDKPLHLEQFAAKLNKK